LSFFGKISIGGKMTDRAFYNNDWEREVRARGGALSKFRLPASSEIQVTGTREKALIAMTDKGLCGNMQTDAAAFEAWALALIVHCEVKQLTIGLAPTASVGSGTHFERFLYRLHRLKELLPQIEIAESLAGGGLALNPELVRRLNQPNPRSVGAANERETRMALVAASNSVAASESALEKALEISDSFKKRFGLQRVMRQWPVGLFNKKVADGRQIFSGTKSAIDLIGIRNGTLVLFELKKEKNYKAGAVSELLFYACVMRDALGSNAAFTFERTDVIENCAISPSDIVNCRDIVAVLLAPRFHPLVSEPEVLTFLNGALSRTWQERMVRFEAVQFEQPKTENGDFAFRQTPGGDLS
jgi:hypothetical protein